MEKFEVFGNIRQFTFIFYFNPVKSYRYEIFTGFPLADNINNIIALIEVTVIFMFNKALSFCKRLFHSFLVIHIYIYIIRPFFFLVEKTYPEL